MSNFKSYFDSVDGFFTNKVKIAVSKCILCGADNGEWYFRECPPPRALVRCSKCSFVWNREQPIEKDLEEFYRKSEAMEQWAMIKDGDTERQNQKFGIFWDYIKNNGVKSVLDVGCGNGYFLKGLPEEVKSLGLEPNPSARRHCNIPVVDPKQVQIKDSFDMATFFGVLEHVKEPHAIIRHYSEFLTDKGLIAVIVPNIESLAFRVLKEKNCSICPQHLWFFSIETLGKLMEDCGFEMVHVQTVETEIQPVRRKLIGLNPYDDLNGMYLYDPVIENDDEINRCHLGAKICAVFRRT